MNNLEDDPAVAQAELEKDAARYRWLRAQGMRWKKSNEIAAWEKGIILDHSIDIAIENEIHEKADRD